MSTVVFLSRTPDEQEDLLFSLRWIRTRRVKRFLFRLTQYFAQLERGPAAALIEVLGDCKVLRARSFIRRVARNNDSTVRYFACQWLMLFGRKNDLFLLKMLSGDHRVAWPFDSTVSEAASWAISAILSASKIRR